MKRLNLKYVLGLVAETLVKAADIAPVIGLCYGGQASWLAHPNFGREGNGSRPNLDLKEIIGPLAPAFALCYGGQAVG